MTSTALISFIGSATTKLRAAGFNGIISTAETVGTFQTYPGICTCLESTVHSNIHGYFSPTCEASDAGSFVLSQISLVEKACGKSVIVSESGWPSSGGSDGVAIADATAQAAAIASLKAITGEALITFFSYTNDLWKARGVEQAFGMLVCESANVRFIWILLIKIRTASLATALVIDTL
jgi:exo-beta-1,3-glucanase (GH17 family)